MLTNFTLTYFSYLSSAITNPKQVVFGSCYTSRSRPPSDRIASAARSDCVRVTMTFREVYVERLYLGGALVSSAPTKLLVLSFRYALLTFSFPL